MKKTSLKAISSCLAAIMLFSTTSAYAATSYAEEISNDIIGKYNSYDKEGTVYIDKALQLLLILLILKRLIWAEMHELFIYHTQAE